MIKYFLIINLFVSVPGIAQSVNMPVPISHYILDSFTTGKVQLKTGARYAELLNYNSLTGEMIFSKQGKYLALADASAVDTVFIQERKFIPANNKFYEVLTSGNTPLLEEFNCTIEELGASTGYGNSTPASGVTSVKALLRESAAYQLKLPDNYKLVPSVSFYILKDNEYHKVSNASQLQKLFPAKAVVIKELVKKNNTKFSRREDMVVLMQQLEH
jgi:hypothetical protein